MSKRTPASLRGGYSPRVHYTPEQLDAAALADLLSDAEQSERQAAEGPYYPERGITADSLRAYAAKCRAQADRYKAGGAHNATIKPEK